MVIPFHNSFGDRFLVFLKIAFNFTSFINNYLYKLSTL